VTTGGAPGGMPSAAPGIDLTARRPELDPGELTRSLTPGARFQEARFETFVPNPAFPSQGQALARLREFTVGLSPHSPGREPRGLFGRRRPREGQGLYLDGGFGVGKTHLLASSYFAALDTGVRAALLSFQDLMYSIGALGMGHALEAFREIRLLCIDEFELDDPGNTHMANTFLAGLMPGGLSVIATSNTQPGALGQGRFNAADFARQIQGIAGRFQNLTLDGPDYRQRGAQPEEPLSEAEYLRWRDRQPPSSLAKLSFAGLQEVLLSVHPARFARLLEGVEGMGLAGLEPMPGQNAALRFVHFVDKAYDLGLGVACTGAPLETLFDESYRFGAFAKKYARCLSRLSELLREARASS